MNARRSWRLPDRFLATLAIAAGALALPTPGMAGMPMSAGTAVMPAAALQSAPDLPAPEAAPPLAPQATAAASGVADAAPEPGWPYLLALMITGLLGGYRRAHS